MDLGKLNELFTYYLQEGVGMKKKLRIQGHLHLAFDLKDCISLLFRI